MDQLNGKTRVGLPWSSLLAFLRITTNPRIFARPLSMEAAWAEVNVWLTSAVAWHPQPTGRHATVLSDLLKTARVNGNLVMDAHLAALAIEHGLELNSADGDFARFPGLRWRNPIAATR